MDREEDVELVRRLGSPEPSVRESAFAALYDKYKDRIFSTSCRILNDRDLAADATQATFLAVFRKARKFDFRSKFSSWLYRVAVNQCLDIRRRRARVVRLSLDDPDTPETGTDLRRETPLSPEASAERGEMARRLRKAVAALSPKLAAVVVLRYMEDLSYEEISEILDLPAGTVKSRLSRAHEALEADLGPLLDQDT